MFPVSSAGAVAAASFFEAEDEEEEEDEEGADAFRRSFSSSKNLTSAALPFLK